MVVFGDAVLGVVRVFGVFEEDARLQAGPVLLPNPGEFEFLAAGHKSVVVKESDTQ